MWTPGFVVVLAAALAAAPAVGALRRAGHLASRTIDSRVAGLKGIDFNDEEEDNSVNGLNDGNPAGDGTVGDADANSDDSTRDETWQQVDPTDAPAAPQAQSSFVDVDDPPPGPHLMVIPSPLRDAVVAGPGLELADGPARNTTVLDGVPLAGPGGATPESDSTDHVLVVAQVNTTQRAAQLAAAEKKKPKVVREWDDQATEGDIGYESLTKDTGSVDDGEKVTLEDQRRVVKGDIDRRKPLHRVWHAAQLQQRHTRVGELPEPVIAPRHHGIKHVALSTAVHKASRSAADAASAALQKAMASAAMKSDPQERMQSQCTAFASYVNGEGVKGVNLLKVMKRTCSGAVRAKVADSAFTVMCNALSSSVEDFVVKPAWKPAELCKAMLKTFNEAGIGK